MTPETAALCDDLFAAQPDLRTRALTRRAYLEERHGPGNYGPSDHHEALEFLGDAWLGALVAEELFLQHGEATEKQLTRTRESLIDTGRLAEIARQHEIASDLRVGAGERAQHQHVTDSSLASHVEALIGASVLAGGDAAARRLVHHLYSGQWPSGLAEERIKDAKGELQRRVLEQWPSPGSEPKYTCEQDPPPPAHPQQFRASVTTPFDEAVEGAWCPRKKDAEQSAARAALKAWFGVDAS